MANAPLRECSTYGCRKLVARGKCPECARKSEREKGTAYERGYDRTWERLRNMVRAEEPLCRACMLAGLVVATEHIDHIVPIREAPALRLFRPNLQGLCASCHGKKSAQESGGRGVSAPRRA
jgi:5-methylcytosine-specific restriction enzyme A